VQGEDGKPAGVHREIIECITTGADRG